MGCGSCLCSIFTWLFAILFNAGALTLIGLAVIYWENWPSALGGSLVYLIILVVTTNRYHSSVLSKHQDVSAAVQNAQAESAPEEYPAEHNGGGTEEQTASRESFSNTSARRSFSARGSPPPRIPFGLSAMYLLLNLAIALPGAIVVFFSFPCSDLDPSDVRRQVYWKTNSTELPENVQNWFENFQVGTSSTSSTGSSIVELSSVMYVYGSYLDAPPQLYAVEEVGVEPKPLGYDGTIRELTAVTDSIVCFIKNDPFGNQLYCGDYQDGFQESQIPRNRYSFGLTGIDGVLWFLQIRSDYYVFDPLRGGSCNFKAVARCDGCYIPACQADTMKVMSLDVTSMGLTSHSRRYTTRRQNRRRLEESEQDEDENEDAEDGYYEDDYYEDDYEGNDTEDEITDDDGVAEVVGSDIFCDGQMLTRLRALGALFLSAIPFVFSSGRVWIKHAIPSASVSLFIAIGYVFYCIWGFFDPRTASTGYGIWLAVGTPVWLLVCTYQVVINPRVSKEPLWWSLYLITTGLVCLLVLQEYWEVINIRAMDAKEITVWVLDILLVHLPFLVIAILTKSVYIALLDIVAFLLLTSIMIWRMTDTKANTMLYGGIAYASVLFLAICVYCARKSLHSLFFRWLSACARHTCAIEATEEEECEENTTGLLLNEEAEQA